MLLFENKGSPSASPEWAVVLCFTFLKVLLNEKLSLPSGCDFCRKFIADYRLRKACASTHTHSIQTVFFSSSVVFLLMTVWLIVFFLLWKSPWKFLCLTLNISWQVAPLLQYSLVLISSFFLLQHTQSKLFCTKPTSSRIGGNS